MDESKTIDTSDFLGSEFYSKLVSSPKGILNIKANSDKLVILLNGAVDRNRSDGPVFQRSSWVSDIPANVLNIADPTVNETNRLSIGWGQSVRGVALDDMSSMAIQIGNMLGVVNGDDRIYFGSSAGGFQAVQLATRDVGSKAIVNNPQTDWTYYMQTSVNAVRRDVYDSLPIEWIRDQYPGNCSIASALKQFGYYPEIDYYVNAESESDVNVHLRRFISEISDFENKEILKKLKINFYGDPVAGQNPLPKGRTISIINSHLTDGNR